MPWYPHPVPQSRKDKTGCKAKTADLQLLRLRCPCFPLPMPALSLPTSPERVTQAGKMHSVHQAWQSSNYQVSMKSPPLNGLKLDSVKKTTLSKALGYSYLLRHGEGGEGRGPCKMLGISAVLLNCLSGSKPTIESQICPVFSISQNIRAGKDLKAR